MITNIYNKKKDETINELNNSLVLSYEEGYWYL
jgi:hypothetical protein